jgi:hypothetical protein
MAVFTRTATGTTADNVTFADSNAVTAEWDLRVGIAEVTGATGFTVSAYTTPTNFTTITIASIGSAGDLELAGWLGLAAIGSYTLPGTETLVGVSSTTGRNSEVILAQETLGTPGTRTLTWATGQTTAGQAFAFQSPAAASGATRPIISSAARHRAASW